MSFLNIQLEKITYHNYKAFSDYTLIPNDKFNCFIGNNGIGKSTTLEILQLLFFKFEGKDPEFVKEYLKKGIRNGEKDFSITAHFNSTLGKYSIELNEDGFVKDHPNEFKPYLRQLCYLAKFDQELHKFSLPQEKWESFKFLFESITGYTIQQEETVFNMDNIDDYVLGFWVDKGKEEIYYKSCSAGEKKVIKTISSLLSQEIEPSIILIDNIEMHVEINKHEALVKALKETFPKSQFFATTHSNRISKFLRSTDELVDLRLMHSNELVAEERNRLLLMDELDEAVSKLSTVENEQAKKLLKFSDTIREKTLNEKDYQTLKNIVSSFIQEAYSVFINDIKPC